MPTFSRYVPLSLGVGEIYRLNSPDEQLSHFKIISPGAFPKKKRLALPGNPAIFSSMKRPVAFRPHLAMGLALLVL
jgi:hypothetical protein